MCQKTVCRHQALLQQEDRRRIRPRAIVGGECPIALVAGFLGPSANIADLEETNDLNKDNSFYWGTALCHSTKTSKVIVLHPSNVASNWDRAIELFYELKGGRVDYGEAHSTEFGHDRFGKTFKFGRYPEWSEDNPIHLVGHSFGGCTIRMLQHLLSLGNVFPGFQTSSRWVLSIVTISSPLNGSIATYSLGAQPSLPYTVRKLSPGYWIGVTVAVAEYLDVGWLKHLMDFGMSHWGLSRRKAGILTGLKRVVKDATVGSSDLFELGDNAAHSMTIHEMAKWNEVIQEDPSCFYLGIVCSRRAHHNSLESFMRSPEEGLAEEGLAGLLVAALGHLAALAVSLCKLLFYLALRCLHLAYAPSGLDFPDGFSLEEWDVASGDGLLTEFTQSHPRVPAAAEAKHERLPLGELTPVPEAAQPGTWYSTVVRADHAGIVPFPDSAVMQYRLFARLFGYLRNLKRSGV